ncbi:hypothetical protein ACJZ2D_008902 [Fusarium nematophilum]
MASTSAPTYFDLIGPIPQQTNLINVGSSPAAKPCKHCASLVPDRGNQYCESVARYQISASFERVDTFPDFPELKALAKAGCSFCYLLRKTIRSSWTTIPMLDLGMFVLADDVGSYSELLSTGWDMKVKIDNPVFRFSPFETVVYGMFSSETDESPPESQQGGVITGLSSSLHPAAEALDEEGETPVNASKTLSFKPNKECCPDLKSPLPSARRRLPDSSTLSPRNIEIMQDWIDSCKSAHGDRCQQVEAWKPTLLIDLGSDNTALPRLVDHLWGKEPDAFHPFQCHGSNFEELKSGIELDLLDGNFLDAIAVSRALGIRYLWTDALCIIQDSRDGDGDATEAMAGRAEDSYIDFAGMWLHNLQHELLWYPQDGSRARTTNCGYPSWSWASLDAEIGFIRGTTDCELPNELSEKKFEALKAGRDSDSRPNRGYIEVAGYCKKLSSLKVFDGDLFSMEMRKEYPLDLVVGESQVLAHGALDLDGYDFLRDFGIQLQYLHVDTETHPTGLILLQDPRSATVFRRVGVATIFEVGGEILLDSPFELADYKLMLTVRSAIGSAIPVASDQVLAVAVPGTLINWKNNSGLLFASRLRAYKWEEL